MNCHDKSTLVKAPNSNEPLSLNYPFSILPYQKFFKFYVGNVAIILPYMYGIWTYISINIVDWGGKS